MTCDERSGLIKAIFEGDKDSFTALQIWINNEKHALTYSELYQASMRGMSALKASGVSPGDRVILLAESRKLEWVVALFAIWQAEATAVLLDASLSSKDFQDLILRSDGRALLTTENIYSSLKDIQMPCFSMNSDFKLISKPTHSLQPTQDRDPSLACLIFTSGTTGHPHGVMLTYANILYVAQQSIKAANLQQSDQVLGILPLNHVFGLVNVLLSTLITGATITFIEKIRGDDMLQAMQRARITIFAATPRILDLIYYRIVHQIREKGRIASWTFSFMSYVCGKIRHWGWGNAGAYLFPGIHRTFGGALTRIISGASPLPLPVFQKFEQIGWTVIEGYGLTETAGIVAGNTIEHRIPGTVGHPVEGIKLMIAHPNAAGEGEICISGPNVMKGYFRDQVATDEMMRNGWLHTGDLGYLDKHGDLIISGRIKELIVTSSGKKAMPPDVEQRYMDVPGIQEIAVVGIKSTNQIGDEIHAAIVVDPVLFPEVTHALQEKIKEDIISCSAQVPNHLRIQHVHFVEEIPKTSTLKVKRSALKEQLTCGNAKKEIQSEEASLEEIPEQDEVSKKVLKILSQYITSKHGRLPKISPNSSLQFDLGIDSLDRTELTTNLEQEFKIKLNEQALFHIDKVSDMIALVRNAKPVDDQALKYVVESINKIIQPIPKRKGLFHRFAFGIFKALSGLIWKTKVEGIENLPPMGAFILCANHQSYLDSHWIFSYLPPSIRQKTCCIARKEIIENRWTALLGSGLNLIPADREGNALPAIKMSMAALQSGRNILIFPEGNRSRSGEMRTFRRGAAHLGMRAGVPLIPVWIGGAYQIFPRHRLLPRFFDWQNRKRYQLCIKFGKPIKPDSESNNEDVLMEKVRREVETLSRTNS